MTRFTQPAPEQRGSEESHRAWDTVFRRPVALKYFPAGMSPREDGAALLAAWERWMTAPHPAFLRPAVLDFKNGWIVREWVAGFTVLELLRQRRKLRADESLRLLEAAPAALDHAAAEGMLPELGLDRFFVQFRGSMKGKEAQWLTRPLEVWPEWTLRIDPCRLTQHLPRDEWKTDRGIMPLTAAAPPAVELLRTLFRELAGAGPERDATPLSTFNDAANVVLASARSAGAPATARRFYDALAEACGAPTRLGERAATRAAAPHAPVAGVLLLEPVPAPGRRLQLISRPELRLGRSSSVSDVVARFPEQVAGAGELSHELSRLHARLRLHQGEISLLDGPDEGASRNGTFLGGLRIEPGTGVRLRGLSRVQLGNQWQASLLPVPSGVTVGSREGERWGALFVVPWPGCMALAETVWLLEEAGFGVDGSGALVWDTEALGTSPGSFYVRGGEFRIGNRRLDDVPIEVDGEPLRPGAAIALQPGARLRIGAGEWVVHSPSNQ
ncbi:MAG TPA: FHA domain-containing protein [Chthoniobacteraceae bacterium]|jgi:hypothetical protein|nr:FHA domain-containing protein [Chthoniobacteraceae bacterium]